MFPGKRCGLTVLELLVVVSIIGMLMALLLPAVQASRESARRAICQSHLKQLALAMLNHESAKGRFPSGGWGFAWAGDPDRGTGKNQPGGWAFSTLPYLERADLAHLGSGKSFADKKSDITLVVQIPVALFNCPTRRSLELSALSPDPPPINFNYVGAVAQTDYAVNAGDYATPGGPGPPSLAAGDDPKYPWVDTARANGICYLRSDVMLSQITDGSSLTYLIGEKYCSFGYDPGDDQTMYAGYDYDACRWAKVNSPPLLDDAFPAPDRFGSAHPLSCNFVFCDGSVRAIKYEISPEVHRRLANRHDALPVDDSQWD